VVGTAVDGRKLP